MSKYSRRLSVCRAMKQSRIISYCPELRQEKGIHEMSL
jgi:hypothetical protein